MKLVTEKSSGNPASCYKAPLLSKIKLLSQFDFPCETEDKVALQHENLLGFCSNRVHSFFLCF